MHPEIGSYGSDSPIIVNNFEDECVGSQPSCSSGIVVNRVEGEKVFVCNWQLQTHFQGKQLLEQFEEAKHSQRFDVSFSDEYELSDEESLNGNDPMLKKLLANKLLRSQQGLYQIMHLVPY